MINEYTMLGKVPSRIPTVGTGQPTASPPVVQTNPGNYAGMVL